MIDGSELICIGCNKKYIPKNTKYMFYCMNCVEIIRGNTKPTDKSKSDT